MSGERRPTLLSRVMWRSLRWLFAAKGWRLEGRAPTARKCVILGAPHTSNWDFVFFAGIVQAFHINASFMGKHTLFRWPLRRFMFDMGGMPIERGKPGGYVLNVVRNFEAAQDMALVIAPEGTRGSKGVWRSGFYHIAHGAGVPIVPGWVDHTRMVGGLGDPIMPTGDYRADMATLLAFYRSVIPDHPRWDVLEASLSETAEANNRMERQFGQ